MKKIYLLGFLFTYFLNSTAQIQSVSVQFQNDIYMPATAPPNVATKFSNSTVACAQDTLQYGFSKASAFNALTVSDGFALGQYYDAPDTVTISGASFYGWNLTGEDTTVDVTVSIYAVGIDSLPTGLPIRQKSISLDSFFGNGLLSGLRKHVTFDTAFTTSDPYIIAISSTDTLRCGVVCNGYANGDGDGENIGCGTVGGTWYRGLNLNVGGTTLDCDMILEPHVSYSIYADFSVPSCYNTSDSVRPQNQSSPFLTNRMYNRYEFYNIGQFSHRWNFGDNFNNYYEYELPYKYNTNGNYDIRLITTIYGWRVNATCYDTAIYQTGYQPSAIGFSADTPVCSGNDGMINVFSTAPIYWYSSPNDTGSFFIGSQYVATNMTSDQTYYVSAQNGDCRTARSAITIPVAQTPNNATVFGDSICLNAQGNISGSSNYGHIVWYDSVSGGTALDTGSVFITNPLTTSTTFYAEANHRGCTSQSRIGVTVDVNANNAPADPITNLDSLVCLYDGEVMLTASSPGGDSIRWYNTPAGGNPIANGNTYAFTPSGLGNAFIYVEADDGSCASSRLQKKITVWNFPEKTIPDGDTLCEGESVDVDFSQGFGSVRWFDMPSGGSIVYDSNFTTVKGLTTTTTFYLEPYSQACRDTMRHPLTFDVLDIGILSNLIGDQICANNEASISASTSAGMINWSLNPSMDPLLMSGESITTPTLTEDTRFYAQSQNAECYGPIDSVDVKVDFAPNANYNFSTSAPGNFNFIADVNGLQYAWDFGDGNTASNRSVVHQYEVNGEFVVVLETTATNGCKSSTQRTITVNGLTGTISVQGIYKEGIVVYPNPAAEHVNVIVPINATYRIYNAMGQLAQIGSLLSGDNRIVLNNRVNHGMYFLYIETKDKRYFHKLIIH